MNNEELFGVIEAMLFAAGAPLEIDKMAEAVEMTYNDFVKELDNFEFMLEKEKRGAPCTSFPFILFPESVPLPLCCTAGSVPPAIRWRLPPPA